MLLVSKSSTTNVGLRSYLNHIFGKYIDMEICLADDVTTALMEKFQLVVFGSNLAAETAGPFMTPNIRFIICIRTLNHTYLNKILAIPANSDVYLVNDAKDTTEESIQLLYTMGITQYHFIPYYPGDDPVDPSIQYAVTLGETRLVPKSIPTVIDIGVRIADISTIAEIVSFFHLPLSIADTVTLNYVNQFVQLLKISNHQLSQATNTKFITQSIISNIDTGICIVDDTGIITIINKQFIKALEIKKSNLVGTALREVVPELDGVLKKPLSQYSPFVKIRRSGDEILSLTLQEIQDTNHKRLTMIHCRTEYRNRQENELGWTPAGSENPLPLTEARERPFYRFSDYRTANERVIRVLEAAKRISLTDYRLLLQGEPGTGKEVLAQAIHNNSSRSRRPFVKLNLAVMSEEQVLRELYPEDREIGILKQAEGGTLYLDGVHHLTERLQREFLKILDGRSDFRLISSSEEDLYELCQEGRFNRSLFYLINEVSLVMLPLRERPEDIPLLFEYFMKNIYNNSNLSRTDVCSDGLWSRLMAYPWPGNGRELENLCKYFYCIRAGQKLATKDLPAYILAQLTTRKEQLSQPELQVLRLISMNPKTGRAGLCRILAEQGIEISEGKMRNILQGLSERGLIKMNRTRGGCEITEAGDIYLD